MRDQAIDLGVHDSDDLALASVLARVRADAEDGRAQDLIVIIDHGVAWGVRPAPRRWVREVERHSFLARRTSCMLIISYVEDDALVAVIGRADGTLTTWWASRDGCSIGAWASRPGDPIDIAPFLSW